MEIYKCERCNYEFKLKSDLKRHYNRKNLCKSVNGDISREELINLFNKRWSKTYQCKKCNKIFYKKLDLMNHIGKDCSNDIISKVDNYECYRCKRTFKTKYTLERHMQNNCKKKIEKNNTPQIIINHNYNNCNIMNVEKVEINNFGKENIEYLNTISYINQLFDRYSDLEEITNDDKNKINSVNLRDIMSDIYFNNEHKENNNIVPVNIKRGIYKVKINGEYIKKDAELLFSNVLDKIVLIYHLLLDKKIDDNDKFIKIKDSLIKLMEFMNTQNNEDKDLKPFIDQSKKVKKFLRKSMDMMASDYKEAFNYD